MKISTTPNNGSDKPFSQKRTKGGNSLPSISEEYQRILDMSWKQKLELATVGLLDLNTQALSIYERCGYLKEDEAQEEDRRYIFTEPQWYFKHQKQMASVMREGNCLIWGMRQLTGKTTTALSVINETLWANDGLRIIHISPSKDLSKELISKAQYDELLYNEYKHTTKMFTTEYILLTNNSKLIVRPCKPSSVQGLTGGLWIDELDKILLEKEKTAAFAAILPIVIRPLMSGKAFIWITCNQATEEASLPFEYLKTILMKFGNFFKVCEIREPLKAHQERELVVLNDFDPQIPEKDPEREKWFIDVIYELQKAIMGEEFAAAQMKNIFLDRSGLWSKKVVLEAFDRFDPEKIPNWDNVEKAILAIDPGTIHGTGYCICLREFKTGDVWIVISDRRYGTEMSEDNFKQLIVDLHHEWNVDEIHCESNSGGLEWINHWLELGIDAYAANFGTANVNTGEVSGASKAFERHYKERVLKDLLEKGKIHIVKSEGLFRDFALYNPHENKEKGKGDEIDAVLHGVFEVVGGVDYILENLSGENEEGEYSDAFA